MWNESKKNIAARGVVSALIIAVIFLSVNYISIRKIDSYFKQMQREATIQNLRVIEGIFKREMVSLSILVTDWAMWDDMYDFTTDRNQEFIDDNFIDVTMSQINVNVVAVVGPDGSIIYSQQFYDQNPQEKEVSQAVLETVKNITSENRDKPSAEVSKIIINDGPKKLLLASRQITKSDGSGTPNGEVFFGRYIERGFLKEFENTPGFYFNVFPYEPDNAHSLSVHVSPESPMIVNQDDMRKVVGFEFIGDISPEHPLVLEIDHIPTIYSRFFDIVIFMVLAEGLAYILAVFALIFFMRKTNPEASGNEK